MQERKTWVIARDGSGDFLRLSDAVLHCAAEPQTPVRFYLKKGVYAERPFIELEDYILEGESREDVILTAGVGGFDPWPGEAKTGTFRSQTLFLGGRNAAGTKKSMPTGTGINMNITSTAAPAAAGTTMVTRATTMQTRYFKALAAKRRACTPRPS